MDRWLAAVSEGLADSFGVPMTLDADEIAALLELARTAAHDSGAKLNAPLVCYLVGRASMRDGQTLQEVSARVRAAVSDLPSDGAA